MGRVLCSPVEELWVVTFGDIAVEVATLGTSSVLSNCFVFTVPTEHIVVHGFLLKDHAECTSLGVKECSCPLVGDRCLGMCA